MVMSEEQKAERRAAPGRAATQRRLAEMLQIEERARQAEAAAAARRQAEYEQYERDGLLPTRELAVAL